MKSGALPSATARRHRRGVGPHAQLENREQTKNNPTRGLGMILDVRERLDDSLAQRILVLDGAMGTMIQRHRLTEAEFRGGRFADHPRDLRGNNDLLVLTRPDVIAAIHREYLAAGSDIN